MNKKTEKQAKISKMTEKRLFNIRLPFSNFRIKSLKRIIFFLLTLLVLAFLGYRFRDKFLAGMVDNQPIFRFQLTGRLYSQYGRQVLEDLIAEKLIYQESKNKGISVSQEELTEAIEKIKVQLGDQTDLEGFLSFQGIKKADFEHQLQTQLLVRKLLESETQIDKEEIAKYISENRGTMEATNQADLNQEAEAKLKEQKISQNLNSWISGLFQKAKVLRFLK